ncbi:Strictosidine synthase [Bertholletia excelsa]
MYIYTHTHQDSVIIYAILSLYARAFLSKKSMAHSFSLSKAMSSKLFLTSTLAILFISVFISTGPTRIFLPHVFRAPKKGDGDKRVIPIEGAVGPECLEFDRHGDGPYTGISDGRIIKWVEKEGRWIDFAVTTPARKACQGPRDHEQNEHICGRPLGLRFHQKTGDLYISDAYMGLLVVGPGGGLASKLATEAQGIPFGFLNGVDVDQGSGVVYFTDSSSRYKRRDYVSVIVSGDKTGRLMKYDPTTKEVTVLLDNLSLPNGVSLSDNGEFIIVAESTTCRILKFWLETSKVGTVEVFADQLLGFPDNIKSNERGEFWVGIHGRRGKLLKWALSVVWMRRFIEKLPFDINKAYSYIVKWTGSGLAVKLSKDGEVLEILEDTSKDGWKFVSEVDERNGSLWIASIKVPFVGIQERRYST